MPILDDQGRLFGRVNIIDAAVLTVVCLLIPVAYGTYWLFRQPLPTVTKLTPSQVSLGELQRVHVTGVGLRPGLRVLLNTTQVKFALEGPSAGELTLPETMAPGVYDLHVYDEAQLVSMTPRLLTVSPPRPPAVAHALSPRFVVLSTDDMGNGVLFRVIMDRLTVTCELYIDNVNPPLLRLKDVPCR